MNVSTQKRFVDELFEDLEARYKTPSPAALAENVGQFDAFLTRTLLPFVGINGFLAGSIVYRQHVDSLAAPLVLAAVVLIGWYLLVPAPQRRSAWLHVGGVATIVLMALLAVPNTLLAALLGFAWSMLLTGAILRRWLPEHASIVYLGYLPWLVSVQLEPQVRVLFELAIIVPMAASFLLAGLRVASLAALTTVLVIGGLEFSRVGSGDLGFTILTIACLALAVAYEWRVKRTDVSAFREFIGQGLPTMLALLAIGAIFDLEEASAWWAWACIVALYQIVQCMREGMLHPTRVGWVVLVLATCLWTQSPALEWYAQVSLTLGLAAVLHLFAAWCERGFLATLALLLAAATALMVIPKSNSSDSSHVMITGGLLIAFLLLAARSRPASEKIPWTRGFLQEEHAQWLRRMSLGALGQLLRIPFVGAVFNWVRTGFAWLSFATGRPDGLGLGDLSYIAAHVLGVVLASNQLTLLLSQQGSTGWLSLVLGAVWVPWGVCLTVAGGRRGILFERMCGIVLIVGPIIAEFAVIRSGNTLAIAMLSAMTGVGLWLTGAATAASPEKAHADDARVRND